MTTETFAQRLARLRENVGIERKSLALLSGTTEREITAFEDGYSEPRIELLFRFAQIFGVSLAYISMLTDECAVCEDNSIYEALILAAPSGSTPTRRDVIGVSFVDKNHLHGREAIGRVMPDEAMENTIGKGDRVILRLEHSAKDGDIVVAKTSGGELIRKYERQGNVVLLKPENPLFDELRIDNDSEIFEIIGVAAEIHRDI